MARSAAQLKERFEELASPVLAHGRMAQMAAFTQHGQTTTLEHVCAVAYTSLVAADALGIRVDERALVRGALLHDYYLYDWHDHEAAPDAWHGFTHPGHALANARRDYEDLTPLEADIIKHHMFPLVPFPPRSREAWIVTLADKACSLAETLLGRPYQRRGEVTRP